MLLSFEGICFDCFDCLNKIILFKGDNLLLDWIEQALKLILSDLFILIL